MYRSQERVWISRITRQLFYSFISLFNCVDSVQKTWCLDILDWSFHFCKIISAIRMFIKNSFFKVQLLSGTTPFNIKKRTQMRTLKFKAQPTDEFFATVNQIFGGLPASDYCRTRGNQIVVHTSSDNETVLGSSRKLGRPAEHLIGVSEKRICGSTFEV